MVVKVKFSCFAGLFPRHAGAFPTEKRETAQHEKALPKIANGTGPGVSLHDSDNMVQVIGFYAVIPERRTNAKRRGRLASRGADTYEPAASETPLSSSRIHDCT